MATQYINVQTAQIIFNCFRQRPSEAFFALVKHRHVSILARVPFARGLLTGKFGRDFTFSKDDQRKFNRRDEAFDAGEAFSGVDYNLGLAAVEVIRWWERDGETVWGASEGTQADSPPTSLWRSRRLVLHSSTFRPSSSSYVGRDGFRRSAKIDKETCICHSVKALR